MSYVMAPDVARDRGAGRPVRNGAHALASVAPEDAETFAMLLSLAKAGTRAEADALRRAYAAGRERGIAEGRAEALRSQSDVDAVERAGLLGRGKLTATEARIAAVLLAHEGRLVPFVTIRARVWGQDGYSEHILRTNMSRMRAKLERLGWCVDTVMCVGYRMHRWAGPGRCPTSRPKQADGPGDLTPELLTEARRLRAGGMSLLRLAREFGRSEVTMRKWLAEGAS